MAKLKFRKATNILQNFCCDNASIEAQIRNETFESDLKIHYIYEVISTNEKGNEKCLGYFCLKFREIALETLPDELSDIDIGVPFSFYAVEIKFLAIKDTFQHKKLGTRTLRMILHILEEKAEFLPFRFVYIDALTELKDWYIREGFRLFCSGEDVQSPTIPMFYDLISDSTLQKIYKNLEE